MAATGRAKKSTVELLSGGRGCFLGENPCLGYSLELHGGLSAGLSATRQGGFRRFCDDSMADPKFLVGNSELLPVCSKQEAVNGIHYRQELDFQVQVLRSGCRYLSDHLL